MARRPAIAPEPRASMWTWAVVRWRPLAALVASIPIAVLATVSTLGWTSHPFPGFFVMCNAVVPTVGLYSWTGMEAGVPFHSRVTAIDGRPLADGAEIYAHAASLPVGTPVHYTFDKGGTVFPRTVATMPFAAQDYWLTVGSWLVNGFLLVAVGVSIGLLQPHTRAARAFLSFGFVTGVCALTGAALYRPGFWWLTPLHLVSQAFLPASFTHCGLVFPEERPFVRRRPAVLAIPYLIAVGLALWAIVDFAASPPRTTALYPTYLYIATSIVIWIGFGTLAYWENRTPTVRARLRPVILGLTLGTSIMLFGFVNIAASGGDFPINLIALTPWLFYLSIAYAIVKHDLFDIDALLKQTVVYLTLTIGITVAYVASIAALGLLVPPHAVGASPLFNVAFVVLVASLFHPLRVRVQHVIDRVFYRSQLDYRRTVVELSAALTSLLDLEEILERVARTLTDGLHIRSLGIVLWLEDRTEVWRRRAADGRVATAAPAAYPACHRRLMLAPRKPLQIPLFDTDAEGEPAQVGQHDVRAEMHELDATLLVPLTLGETVIGAFALGPRHAGHPFSRDDLEILTTLAAESAIAIQNARSYRALLGLNENLESMVHARTAELQSSNAELALAYEGLQTAQAQLLTTEKMASLGLIVAGVAHEINNPLSFIIGNVDPLQQTLARLQALAETYRDAELSSEIARLTKILDLMALGAERTASIVQDLRTFSRLGEAQPRPTDLHEAIDVSLRLLRPRWVDRITIHRAYGSVPAVEVIPGQINQVLMNVLANACDAIRGRGNLWITTAASGPDVVIAIRDDGAGIAPEYVTRIFDPFFTTKSVGKGTGLGLAITHGIVSHHGGTIRVTTEPGRGTDFSIVLPIRGVLGVDQGDAPVRSTGSGGGA